MIDWLKLATSAHFFCKRRRIPKVAIVDLFKELRQGYPSPSNNIFHNVKEPLSHAHWSAIAFYYDQDPSFLDLPDGQNRERVCAYLFMVEYKDMVVISRMGFDTPSEFKTEFLDRVGNESVEGAFAGSNATFEQLRLKNMVTSKHAMRSKTLEANDLASVMGPAGASRYVPRGYRTRTGADRYSTTPSTGKISLRSDRVSHEGFVRWAIAEIDKLAGAPSDASQFIKKFSRPIDLASLPAGTAATHLAINTSELADELFHAENPKRLLMKSTAGFAALTQVETESVLTALDQTFRVRASRGELRVGLPDKNRYIGKIAINKTRISLRTFDLPEIDEIYIETAIGTPGSHADCDQLARYVNYSDLFTVLFSDFRLAYMDGTLYRDDQFADGGGSFLKYFRTNAHLAGVLSEKGQFAPNQTEFAPASVFRIVIDEIAASDELLICDDLGTEWADFIGVNSATTPKTISFYHAKHGVLSLGASSFHVAVSQAIKNLGRMALAADAIVAKIPLWSNNYSNANVQTQIPRVCRGAYADILPLVEEARGAPDTIRRTFIVTSSISKVQIEQAFAQIQAGNSPSPHFVQLYWLLMSYFSACLEANVYPYVVCQP